MKTKLFSFVKCSENSMIASVRIARMVAEELKTSIVIDASIARDPLDVLFIVNGAYAFSSALPALGAAILAARHVVWIQNDYTIIPPKPTATAESPFRRSFVERREKGKSDTDFWSTCHDWSSKTPGSCYINWNCLTFDLDRTEKQIGAARKKASDDLFYYGAWRINRKQYFDQYFTYPQVRTVVSSPVKQFNVYPSIQILPKITERFHDTLASHGMGLYIEDRPSHQRFHSPANRFYEMLSAGLPMMFQIECGAMMRKAGYNPTPWTADTKGMIKRLFERRDEILHEQRKAWLAKAKAERLELPLKIREAVKKLEKNNG